MHNIFCFFNEYSLFSFLFLYLIHKCCTHKSSFIIRGDIFKGILLNSKWNLIVSCGICAPKIISLSKLFLWFEMFIPRGGLIIPLGYNFLLIFLSSGKKNSFPAFQFLHKCASKALRLFLRIVPMQTPTIFSGVSQRGAWSMPCWSSWVISICSKGIWSWALDSSQAGGWTLTRRWILSSCKIRNHGTIWPLAGECSLVW